MLINYTPENGFSWVPTLLGLPAIRSVHEKYGEVGVYYVLAFGHTHSHLRLETDFDEREVKVLAEIKDRKVKAGRGVGKIPQRFYASEECELAIQALNKDCSTPSHTRLARLREQEAMYERQLSGHAFDKDPEKRTKELTADKNAFEILDKIRRQQREEESHINKMNSKTGMISLDDLLE